MFSDVLLDMTCAVPIELTVLGRELTRPPKPRQSPVVIGEWRKAYDLVCSICRKHHIVTRNLYKGSKTAAVTAARKEIIRELTALNVGIDRIANFCGVELVTVYYHQMRMGLRAAGNLGQGNKRYRQLNEDCHAAMPAL